MKAYWGSGGIASTHSFTSALDGDEWSASRLGPRYPLDRRTVGPKLNSGRGGEEKSFQLPPGIEQ